MGFGCNAAGVVGCRIIDSKRERLIALLTNSFVPCNGRFPTLIVLISLFLVGVGSIFGSILSSVILSALIIVSIITTLLVSGVLSKTILSGVSSAFTLELPPYRTPDFGRVIIRSVVDRTLIVLLRSVAFAAPAGLFIWLIANVKIGNVSILLHISEFLDPMGRILGMDGAIILAFILALPANEIMLPILMMIYSSGGSLAAYSSTSELFSVLTVNGWTLTTAVCVIIFTLFHFPCATTLMTVKKETGDIKWVILAALLPTVIGASLCFVISLLSKIFFF